MRLICTLSLLLTISSLSAQPNLGTWQWARQAGGVFNTGSNENEQVNDMCTDKYGNIYTVGSVYKNPYFNGQQFFAPFASFGSEDGFVAKYDNCGNLKWVRFMGTPCQDYASEVAVDDSLNVYVLGFLCTNNGLFPDSSHTVTVSNPGLFWAKYDSLGNVKWANTTASINNGTTSFASLNVRADGNLTTTITIDTGLFYSGFNYVSSYISNAIIKIDLNGNPINILQIDSSNYYNIGLDLLDMVYDSRGNIVFSYQLNDTTQIFDTTLYTPINNLRSFLIKANPQTNKIIWIKEWREDDFGISGFVYLNVDANNNIYGNASAGLNSVFNGDSMKFNSTAAYAMNAVFKLDSNGNTLWYDIADNTDNANTGVNTEPFSLYGNSYICVPINVSGPTYWGGDTLNGNGSFYLTFLKTTDGKLAYSDTVHGGNPLNTAINKTIADYQGNIMLGGYFSQGLIAGSSTINNIGGINDAFVLKWGVPCAEDSVSLIPPQPAIDLVAYASTLHSIDVDWQNVSQYAQRYRVYRSTTDSSTGYSVIDSVSNSTTQYTDTNVLTNQIYWYRVSAVNGAGETFSNSDSAVIIPNGIADLSSDIKSITIYPNPAANYTKLSIWSNVTEQAMISISDIEGREFYSKGTAINQGKNDFIMDLSGISEGVYVVNMSSGNGTYSQKLVVIK